MRFDADRSLSVVPRPHTRLSNYVQRASSKDSRGGIQFERIRVTFVIVGYC